MSHLNKSIFSFHHKTSRGPHYVWLSHKLSNHPNIHAWIENNCVWLTNKISNWTWTSRIDNDCCIFRIWETENAWPPSQNLICLNIHGFWAFPATVSTRLAADTCYWLLPVISVRICPGPEYFDKIPRQQQRCTDGAASKAENLWAIFLQRIVIMMDICSYSGLFNLRM